MRYNLDQAACLTGCSRRQLRYWVETGLIEAGGGPAPGGSGPASFSFRNLVELRTVRGMLENGISLRKVRRTLDYLTGCLGVDRPLAECRLVTDGSSVFKLCSCSGELIDTLREGQFVFAIALGDLAAELEGRCFELEREREAFILSLLADDGAAGDAVARS